MSRHPFVVRQTTRCTFCEPGPIHLSTRIVIMPITRSQTRNAVLAPDPDIALYYAQRASAKVDICQTAASKAIVDS
jgi:2,4-dienoyl-CoA reductase-like NADH-dependent reductase (Old Yellow Enzyme family)